MNTKNILEKMTNILLYICIIVIPIPSTFLSISVQLFLAFAMIYVLASVIWLYKENKLKETICKGKLYVVFVILMFTISTVKYVIELLSDKNITFFTVYQMVIFSVFGFFVFAKIYINNNIINKLFMIYAYTTTMLIIINQNKYMFDLGAYRFEGAYKNPNILALHAVVAIMSLIYLIFHKAGLILINEICIGICLASCLLSQSRGGMLGMITGILTVAIFEVIKRKKAKWMADILKRVVIVMLITIITLILFKPSYHDKGIARIVGIPNALNRAELYNKEYELLLDNGNIRTCSFSEKSIIFGNADDSETNKNDRFSLDNMDSSSIKNNMRYSIWKEYLKNSSDFFWFGTDYSLNKRPVINGRARDPHNTLIYLFFRYGIFVVLSMAVIYIYIGIMLCKNNRGRSSVSVIAGLLMSMLVISLVNDLPNTTVYYFVISVAYAYIYVKKDRGKSEKVNVLHVFSTLNKGGAESRMMDIYRKLDRNSIQFDFIVTSPNPKQHYFYKEIKELGGEIYEIVSWRKTGFKGLFMQWRKILKSKNYSAVHAHTSVEEGIGLFFAWLNNVPVRIAHARNGGVYNVSRLRKAYLNIAKITTIVFSTHKLYCSEEAARYLFSRFYKMMPKTYFIPNAIELKLYSAASTEKSVELKKDLGIPDCEYIIGTVGNARKVKNHIFLVKVFKKILEINPKSVLVIVGRNEEDQEAKKFVRDNKIEDKVFFAGQRDDIIQFLHIFDTFVLPSLSEGAPGSVIEAQAAGVPCILSDSITRAVDAGCGLVKYISLDAGICKWADEILLSCKTELTDIDYIHSRLYQKGYDVSESMNKLVNIYKSEY